MSDSTISEAAKKAADTCEEMVRQYLSSNGLLKYALSSNHIFDITGIIEKYSQTAINADRAAREKESLLNDEEKWTVQQQDWGNDLKWFVNQFSQISFDSEIEAQSLADAVNAAITTAKASANAATPLPPEIVTLLGQAEDLLPLSVKGDDVVDKHGAAVADCYFGVTEDEQSLSNLIVAAVNFVAQLAKGATPMPMEVVSEEDKP